MERLAGLIDGQTMLCVAGDLDKYSQNDDCMNQIHRQYVHTHSQKRIFFAQISCTRHFFP